MKFFKLLLLILVLAITNVSCQKDGTYFQDPPKLTTNVRILRDKSALFTATMTGNTPAVRGFIISLVPTATIKEMNEAPQFTDIIYCHDGIGDFGVLQLNLHPGQDYWVAAFAYYYRQSDMVVYGNTVKIQVN